MTATGVGPDERLEMIDRSLKKARYAQDQLIELLHKAQDVYGYLPVHVLEHLAVQLELPASRVYGVATFYHLFSLDPPGEHTCTVCTGTACFVKGADDIVAAVQDAHGVIPGGTTEDGRFSLATARCLGSCGLAPVVVIDGEVAAHQTPQDTLVRVQTSLVDGADDGEVA